MENVDLFINNENAREKWGVITTPNTLSALLTPPSMKERPTFSSRLENGSRIDNSDPKVAQRELNLEIQMIAPNPDVFYQHHAEFCKVLASGEFTLATSDRPDVIYHLLYNSCNQYTQFARGIATLSLKVTEANPTNL